MLETEDETSANKETTKAALEELDSLRTLEVCPQKCFNQLLYD